MGQLSPFCSVCSGASAGECTELKAQQPGFLLLLLQVLHSWGSWNTEWEVPCSAGALLRVSVSPVLLGEHKVRTWGSPAGSPQGYPLGDLYLFPVFVISRNFGKRLKDPPRCCAGALWDTLGLFSSSMLGFIRLGRSTQLFFYLIFFSCYPQVFPSASQNSWTDRKN